MRLNSALCAYQKYKIRLLIIVNGSRQQSKELGKGREFKFTVYCCTAYKAHYKLLPVIVENRFRYCEDPFLYSEDPSLFHFQYVYTTTSMNTRYSSRSATMVYTNSNHVFTWRTCLPVRMASSIGTPPPSGWPVANATMRHLLVENSNIWQKFGKTHRKKTENTYIRMRTPVVHH